MKRNLKRTLGLTALVALSAGAQPADKVARPPQHVLMAFDGGLEARSWEETLQFARESKAAGADVKFTVFISGTYFVTKPNRNLYHSPAFPPCKATCPGGESDCPRRCHTPGQASISFGGESIDNVKTRVDYLNVALGEGHEIGSHANGHFDGSGWTEAEWDSEFNFFSRALFDTAKLNKLGAFSGFPKLNMPARALAGFRAPFLATSPGMYPALQRAGYRYDTSNDNEMEYWPRKNKFGLWNFPLANVPVPGTAKRVLSMDYNFFVMDGGSKAEETIDEARSKAVEDKMYATYIGYFRNNYFGNRAPVHIGHHFTAYMKGAYWRALKRVARDVCGLPEVRCVKYSDLADFMDSIDEPTRLAYQAGRFDKYVETPTSALVPVAAAEAPIDADAEISVDPAGNFNIQASGPDADQLSAKDVKWFWTIDGQPLVKGLSFNFKKFTQLFKKDGAMLEVRAMRGKTEVFRSLRSIRVGLGGIKLGHDLDRAARFARDPIDAHDERWE
jgi:peptidoglycan/xylan/chitin deacetylase (PgdA/CDA1 family)